MQSELEYLKLLEYVMNYGTRRPTRTGVDTYSIFSGTQLSYDLSKGYFPLLTTKKVYWKGVVAELLWFLKGSTNVKELQEQNVHIWDEWADEDGELGPVYGSQWRNWNGSGIDQITQVIETLKTDPYSRRMLVSAWNPEQLGNMALPPCHSFFQLYYHAPREEGGKGSLSLHMYQRSADIFLGVPFNIASYALLTHLLAQVTGLRARDLFITFGDLHMYVNHKQQACRQLGRVPRMPPNLVLNPDITDISKFTLDDISLLNYAPQSAIPAPIAV